VILGPKDENDRICTVGKSVPPSVLSDFSRFQSILKIMIPLPEPRWFAKITAQVVAKSHNTHLTKPMAHDVRRQRVHSDAREFASKKTPES
jgi:hypothetical protein